MTTYVAFFGLILLAMICGTGARRISGSERIAWAVYGAFGVVMAVYIWQASLPPVYLSDFKKAYYPAGEIIRSDPDLLYPADVDLLFVNIPLVAWLFAPFSYLSITAAGALMTALGLLAILGSYAGLVMLGRLTASQAALLAGAFVINGPLYYSVREGNTTHFILLLLVGVVWLASISEYVRAGVVLGCAAIIKPPLALIGLPFALQQRWGFVAAVAMTGLAVGGLSLAIYGMDLHRDWYDYAVRPYSEHPLGAENVQSIDGVLARLYTDDYIDDFTPIEELDAGFRMIRMTLAAALLLTAAAVLWRGRRSEGLSAVWTDVSIATILALLIAPTSWTHYYTLVLLPIGLAIAGGLGAWTPWRAGLFAIAVLLVSPPVVYVGPDTPVLGSMVTRVFMSHYFYGGLLMLALLLEARWRGAAAQAEEASSSRAAQGAVVAGQASLRMQR